MINTYQTSLAPPPVPPRQSGSHQVLIPTPLPSPGHSKSLLQFMVGVVLLNLFLTVGGFFYLAYIWKMEKPPQGEAKGLCPVDPPVSEKQTGVPSKGSDKAFASMVIIQGSHTQTSTAGYLQWDDSHSLLRNVSLFYKKQLIIQKSGKYHVYSKVTFSSGDSARPLASTIMLKKSTTDKEKAVMKAYCNLEGHRGTASIPRLCTATQGEVMALEKGNQLSVWVQDLSKVDYDEGATAFGMYEL